MKILVTGGSGFLASHISDRLSIDGHIVKILDKKISIYKNSNQKFLLGDINDRDFVINSLKNIDIVYHFAAFADINKAK